MTTFDLGETVICSCEVKNDAGTFVDPATSMTIKIINPNNKIEINGVNMTKDAVGKYHYDFDSSAQGAGKYIVRYIATDGTRITIEKDEFDLG